jgi:cell wall assembly regulator SMI1
MKDRWKILEKHLEAHEPEVLSDLNPPATDADITTLQAELGLRLPADFIACLQIHDGQQGRSAWLFDGHEFLSSSKILRDWRTLNTLMEDGDFDGDQAKPDAGVRGDWWSPQWVPFTANGGGDHFCLDLAPASGGQYGQIIKYSGELPGRRLQAPSFSDWFDRFLKARTGC